MDLNTTINLTILAALGILFITPVIGIFYEMVADIVKACRH